MGQNEQGVRAAERLFPFVLRARKLVVGRERLKRSKGQLQWLLVTTDITEGSLDEIRQEYGAYPIVQHYTSRELEDLLQLRGTKLVGFAKSSLAKSIYAGLKEHRINKPPTGEAAKAEGAESDQEV